MFPTELHAKLKETAIIAVLVIDDAKQAVPLARSLLRGGVNAMELTLRTDAALDALRAIRQEVPEMLAGIGTILTIQQIDEVVGAEAAAMQCDLSDCRRATCRRADSRQGRSGCGGVAESRTYASRNRCGGRACLGNTDVDTDEGRIR